MDLPHPCLPAPLNSRTCPADAFLGLLQERDHDRSYWGPSPPVPYPRPFPFSPPRGKEPLLQVTIDHLMARICAVIGARMSV